MIFAPVGLSLAIAILGQVAAAAGTQSPGATNNPGVTMQGQPTAGPCKYSGSHTATIQLTVTPQGRPVDEAIAVSSGSKCLDAQALKTVAGYHFNPSMKNGQATESHIRIQVNYKRF